MLLFVLISSFDNINWHCLYVLECFKLLLASLKLRNLGHNPSWWQLCKNCKSVSFFEILKSSFSNLRNHLTASVPYLLRRISATDLFAGNLSFSKRKEYQRQNSYNHVLLWHVLHSKLRSCSANTINKPWWRHVK